MAFAENNDSPTCPFCTFEVPSQQDLYFLIQHVELCHPENGTSPFITAEELTDERQAKTTEEESASSTETPSEDDAEDIFVDCPAECGETITLAELSTHMEMHGAEGMAVDESGSAAEDNHPPRLHGGRARVDGGAFTASPLDHLPSSQEAPGSSSPATGRGSRKKRKNRHGGLDWKDLLFGPAPANAKPKTTKSKQTAVRRLGVRILPAQHYLHTTDSLYRELS